MININKPKKNNVSLDSLVERHKHLSTRKIQVETELKRLQSDLDELVTFIKETYDVDGLDDLRALYKRLTDENNQNLTTFISEIEKIESQLAELEG